MGAIFNTFLSRSYKRKYTMPLVPAHCPVLLCLQIIPLLECLDFHFLWFVLFICIGDMPGTVRELQLVLHSEITPGHVGKAHTGCQRSNPRQVPCALYYHSRP